MLAIFDYDPRPAMERISVPTLALFGGDDAIVPVDESVAVYREAVRPDLLTLPTTACRPTIRRAWRTAILRRCRRSSPQR
jgi:fermentation-respiration switch protein FrsA (DUF1100 family)